MSYKLGAHLSVSGGYNNALNKIVEIGGNCLQIFASSPKGWNFLEPEQDQIDEFRSVKEQLKIDPIYFHASYLINCANSVEVAGNTRKSLIRDLNVASKMGIRGSIVHTGSFKDGPSDFTSVVTNIKMILEDTPSDTDFIIENAGNKKIGQKLEEIAEMLKLINNDRVKVCLDTCHLYSAGYDLSSEEKVESLVQNFDSLIGLDKLEVFHLNDSKDPYNSGRDRHENIGQGTLGTETFQAVLRHPKLKKLPFIIETPGFDDKGPDKENLDILKNLI